MIIGPPPQRARGQSLPQRAREEWDRVWRSIFRVTWPRNDYERANAMFTGFFLHFHSTKARLRSLRVTYSFGLGVISLYLFIALTITGFLLMFYYVPSIERAYEDVRKLSTEVPFGLLLRNLHRWSAHAMVMAVFLHMLRVFYTGSYKAPREFNWVIGVLLMVSTLLLSFTGYLLPWDQLAFWAITVGTNIADAAPLIGPQLRFALLGASEVGQDALIRFYVLHVIVLPSIALIFIGVHLWRVRKDTYSV